MALPLIAMRAFLAVDMEPALREAHAAAHPRWKRLHPELRWVAPENLHLTLRFLGQTREELLDAIRGEVERIASGEAPFRMSIGDSGCFGSIRKPRVLWFGITEGAPRLAAMAERLEKAVQALGFVPEERPWRGHLTVARNPRSAAAPGWGEALASGGLTGLVQDVTHVTLFSSRIQPGGAVYTPVWKAALGYSRPPFSPEGGRSYSRPPSSPEGGWSG